MDLPYNELDNDTLLTLIDQHRTNLALWAKQSAQSGPLDSRVQLMNQIDHTKREIQAIRAELSERGTAYEAPTAKSGEVLSFSHLTVLKLVSLAVFGFCMMTLTLTLDLIEKKNFSIIENHINTFAWVSGIASVLSAYIMIWFTYKHSKAAPKNKSQNKEDYL